MAEMAPQRSEAEMAELRAMSDEEVLTILMVITKLQAAQDYTRQTKEELDRDYEMVSAEMQRRKEASQG